ncbi:MAG: hypothetical protein MRZ79_14775 [Bacteroidia bacterium]|nr:hypothetical protein [Bacteroidia bacterium]
MDLKRLPFLPIQYFYHQFSRVEKVTFLFSLALILVSGGFLTVSYINPTQWALDTYVLQSTVGETAQVDKFESNYREFDVNFPVYWQKMIHAAGPILPKSFPFLLFVALQVLAWTLVISVTTNIKSRWIYLFYFLFLLFIHFSGIHQLWFEEESLTGRLVEFGIICSYLIPTYLFQVRILNWSFGIRLLIFSALSLLWFGVPLMGGDVLDAHGIMQNAFYFNIFLFIPFAIFAAKDLVNLVVLVGNNRPQKESRWSMGIIFSIIGLLLIIELSWMHEFFNWNFLGEDFRLGLRPSYLLIVVAFFTPFTSQNLYHQVRSFLNSQFVFVIFLASWGVLAMSFAAVCLATGDMLFNYALDRMLAIFFLSVTLFYSFFILANHAGYLRRKINFYYLMTQATDFSFFVVWLLSLGGIVVIEGMEKWKSLTLISHTYTMNIGDEAWYKNEFDRAEKAYSLAAANVASSVKANYNLANLYLLKPKSEGIAIEAYKQSVKVFDFEYGWLNAAQLLNETGNKEQATVLLNVARERMPLDSKIANNLALNFWEGSSIRSYQADSAISIIKKALLNKPEDEILLSHLGIIYHQNELSKEAESFFKASIESDPAQKGVWTNYLVWNLQNGNKFSPYSDEYSALVNKDFWLTYHHFLMQKELGSDTLGLQLLKQTANKASTPEAILLDGWRLLKQDSMELGESRLTFLANTNRQFAPAANQLLGYYFLEHDMPAKARFYFKKQGEAGDAKGKLYATFMNLDMGFLEAGNKELTLLRGQEPELFPEISRELAILLKAYGQEIFAQTEWDLSTLNLNERMRAGIYSDSIGQYAFALENFRQVIDYDSMTIAPYLELGRIYNKYRDTLSVTNLTFGLEKDPDNKEMLREMALGYIYQKRFDEALSRMDTSSTETTDRLVYGEWLFQKDQIENAEMVWDSAFKMDQTYRPLILRMARHYAENNEIGKAYDLISKALYLNDQNPDYWYYLALFAEGYGELGEAKLGREKVEELYPEGKRKEIIKKSLQKPLRP